MIKILIADDHPIVRAGLKQILNDAGHIQVTAEADNGSEVLALIKKKIFDVILLDISMPGKGGIDTLKQISDMKKHPPVLIISTHPEEQYAIRSIRAGAAGYITKISETSKLIGAIEKVASGRKYISETLAERLAYDIGLDKKRPLHETLSDREYEVFCKIASGKTVSEIANEMALSVKTISTYRARILEKTNMKNNAEITHYAIKNNLVE
ncbi:MAG: response regulator transcription factor [Candidatus Omnitrophica bacterium]|nr:response regulator transcription factor [Candidatus Omnitrophota bacterium]